MARLLCLKAAWMIDQGDARAAAPWISQIKVVAPRVALKVTDEAVQMFGGARHQPGHAAGAAWTHLRTLQAGRRAGRRASPPGGARPSSGNTRRKRCERDEGDHRPRFRAARPARLWRLAGAGGNRLDRRHRGRGDRRQLPGRAAGAGPLPDEAAAALRARHGGRRPRRRGRAGGEDESRSATASPRCRPTAATPRGSACRKPPS